MYNHYIQLRFTRFWYNKHIKRITYNQGHERMNQLTDSVIEEIKRFPIAFDFYKKSIESHSKATAYKQKYDLYRELALSNAYNQEEKSEFSLKALDSVSKRLNYMRKANEYLALAIQFSSIKA